MSFHDRILRSTGAPLSLIFQDWGASIARQAQQLREIIKSEWGSEITKVLDVSCGIGTQAIGLAQSEFRITGSDLSPEAIARAKRETAARALKILLSVPICATPIGITTAVTILVISCDNSIPHLLNDDDILTALRQMHACLCPGGGCLLTMRDYDREERGKGIVKPYGVRESDDKSYLVFQVWDWEENHYDLTMYFVEENRSSKALQTHAMRSRYYAISPSKV